MHAWIPATLVVLFAPISSWANSGGVDQALAAARLSIETNQPTTTPIRITLKSPDSRLKLSTCDQSPTAEPTSAQRTSGKVTVKVHCSGPAQWTIYIPATIHRQVQLWTSRRNISRGSIINVADIELNQQWLVGTPAGALQDVNDIQGMLARQTIQAGQVIKQRLLKKPMVIHKGQRVSAAVQQRGFRLTTEVVPLEDGANGDTIKVLNASTDKLLWARISPTGELIIN